MNCRYVQSNLQAYIDSAVDPSLALDIGTHLDGCESCAREYRLYKNLICGLNELEIPKLSDECWRNIHDTVMEQVAALPQKRTVTPFAMRLWHSVQTVQVRAVAALLVISLVTAGSIMFIGFRADRKLLSFFGRQYPTVVAVEGMAFSGDDSDDATAVPVQGEMALPPGRSIRTDDKSSLEIQVDKKSSIRLGRNSNVSVADLAAGKTVFTLKKGDLAARVSKRNAGELFIIQTPNAVCEVIGTRFDVTTQHDSYRKRFITTLVVHEGTVKFGSLNYKLPVKAGSAIAMFGDSLGVLTMSDDPLIRQLYREPGRGLYTINSTPDQALVLIDGIPVGFTPLCGSASFGSHTVTCLKKGFGKSSGTLTVDAGSNVALELSLGTYDKDNGYGRSSLAASTTLDNPLLLDATEQMVVGNYAEALSILEPLCSDKSVQSDIRASALSKAARCNKYLQNYPAAINMLNRIVDGKYTMEQRGAALFERATMYRTSLHEAKCAISDYKRYLDEFKDGIWSEEASRSLAELLYLVKDYAGAASEYRKYCDVHCKGLECEQVLYRLGTIYANNLSDPARALDVFNRLLLENPQSEFADDAVFWSADCLMRQGHASRAMAEFEKYTRRYPNGKWFAEAKTRLRKIDNTKVQ